jgi:hypothetical protein
MLFGVKPVIVEFSTVKISPLWCSAYTFIQKQNNSLIRF